MLYNPKAAIAFDTVEKGHVHDFIEPLHDIPTIPYKAWQAAIFQILQVLHKMSVRLL